MTKFWIIASIVWQPVGSPVQSAEVHRTLVHAQSVEQCNRDFAPGVAAEQAKVPKVAADAAAVRGRVVAKCQRYEVKP